LDTREKIIDLAAATGIAAGWRGRGVRWKFLAGYFDVLTPAHVRGLPVGGALMAAVLDPPDPLLPARARAELAASLRMVDYVVLLEGALLDQALEQLQPDEVIRAEIADLRRAQTLIEHVHRRHRA
jgi:glycerol-3-phosphate cytidylyltransferase-like family protein